MLPFDSRKIFAKLNEKEIRLRMEDLNARTMCLASVPRVLCAR